MPLIAANGTKLNYILDGKSGAPLVVLSNSLSTDLRMWQPQASLLATHYQVLRYDTRGHGWSDPAPAPYSVAMLADDLAGLLDGLGLASAHIVGLSLGGMTAQMLAVRRPELVASMALVATTCAPPFGTAAAWAKRADDVRVAGDYRDVEAPMLDRWLTRRFRRRNPAGLALIREMILATPLEGYIGCCHAIGGLDVCGQLANFPRPVAIVAGEEDPGTTVEDAERILSGISHARLTVLPGARHLLNWDAEAAFTPWLMAWLAGVT
jgi:3-oxoadipate enol-lactonase